jgi:hypothetical protein
MTTNTFACLEPDTIEAEYVQQYGGIWLYREESGCPTMRVEGHRSDMAEFFLGDMFAEVALDFADAFKRIAADQGSKEAVEAYERAEYERLAKKFGGGGAP